MQRASDCRLPGCSPLTEPLIATSLRSARASNPTCLPSADLPTTDVPTDLQPGARSPFHPAHKSKSHPHPSIAPPREQVEDTHVTDSRHAKRGSTWRRFMFLSYI